jgi:hypothetical protein
MPHRRLFAAILLASIPLILLPGESLPEATRARAPRAELFGLPTAKGAQLRWNVFEQAYPPGGFAILRTAEGDAAAVRITAKPVRPHTEAEARTILGARVKPQIKRPAPKQAPTDQDRRKRDALTAFLAEMDVAAAKSMGLFFEDTTAKAGTRHQYELKAIDGQGAEQTVAVLRGIVPGPATPLPSVAKVDATADAVSIRLSWTGLDPRATRTRAYYVHRALKGRALQRLSDVPVVCQSEKQDGKAPSLTYVDRAVEVDTAYTYAVVAADAFGRESAPSPTVDATFRDIVPPATPTDLAWTNHIGMAIELTWKKSASADLAGYYVYRMPVKGVALERITPNPLFANATRIVDSPKTPGHYVYTVTAVDLRGNESPRTIPVKLGALVIQRPVAGVVAIVPDQVAPAAPGKPVAEAKGDKIGLTWTASTEEDLRGYVVYRGRTENGPFRRIASTKAASFADAGSPFMWGTFFYKVAAVDRAGNESPQGPAVSAERKSKLSHLQRGVPGAKYKDTLPAFDANAAKEVVILRSRKSPYAADFATKPDYEEVVRLPVTAKEFEDKTGDASYFYFFYLNYGETSSRIRPVKEMPPVALEGKTAIFHGFRAELRREARADVASESIDADFKLPWFDANTQVRVAFEKGKPVSFGIVPEVSVNLQWFQLKATRLEVGREEQFGSYIDLDGQIDVERGDVRAAGVRFTGLRIYENGRTGGGVSLQGEDAFCKGFTFDLNSLDLGVEEGAKCLKFGADIRIDGIGSVPCSLRPRAGGVSLDRVDLSFDMFGLEFSGQVAFEGNALKGSLRLSFETFDMGFEVQFLTGKDGNTNYFQIQGELTIPANGFPIGNTGLAFKKFGLGFGYNREVVVNGNALSFRTGRGWFCQASVGIQTFFDNGLLLKGDLTLTLGTSGVVIQGHATVLEKADVDLFIAFTSRGFEMKGSFTADFSPIAKGGGTVELFFGKGKGQWYVHFGTKESPIQGEILGGLTRGSFYLTLDPVGDSGVKFGAGMAISYGTGRLWAWIFFAEVGFEFSADLEVNTSNWTFRAAIHGKAWAYAGAQIDCFADTYTIEFGIEVEANGVMERTNRGLRLAGSFEIGFELPVYGYESVSVEFDSSKVGF